MGNFHGNICHASNEKRQTTPNEQNRTTKPRQRENSQRKNLKLLEVLEANNIK